jgi:hypothetical protein
MGTAFSPGSGHINQALTNLVIKHPSNNSFIADEIANRVPVPKDSDKFFKINSAHLLDHSARVKRAAGTESNKVSISWDEDSYLCEEKSLHADLDWNTRDNADSQLGIELETAAVAREGVLLAREIAAAAALFSTTNLTNNGAVANKWNDGTVANIKAWQDILDAKRKVRKFGGVNPTHIAMGDITWVSLAKYVIAQSGTPAGVRWAGIGEVLRENPDARPQAMVGLRLLVGDATYSTAMRPEDVDRDDSTGNISDVWADNALVFHKGQAGLKTVQLAARFVRNGYPQVRQGTYAGPRKCDWYEYSEHESGMKIIAPSVAFLITNTEQ